MISIKIPTYQNVIDDSQEWKTTNSPEDLERAEILLREGLVAHPYALPIGDELVLVLESQDRQTESLALLKQLEARYCDTGEETLCRFGKNYKKRAERVFADNPAVAIQNLEESERYYTRAYEKSYAFYPRINQLNVRFLLAACFRRVNREVEATRLLHDVQKQAADLLTAPPAWQSRQDDDEIWIRATLGEIHLLLKNFPSAEKSYLEALEQAQGRHFYHKSMCDQVLVLLTAYRHLGIEPVGAIANPLEFFKVAGKGTAQ